MRISTKMRSASRSKALVFLSTLVLASGTVAIAACSGSSTMAIDNDDSGDPGSDTADGSSNMHSDASHAADSQPAADGSHDQGDAGQNDGSGSDGSISDARVFDASFDANDAQIDLDASDFTDCSPAILHPVSLATDGVFCPFATGGTATGAYCTTGQFCCKPSLSPSVGVCTDPGPSGANPCAPVTDVSIQCDDSIECNAGNGGTQCCGTGTVLQNPACVGTGAYFGNGFAGTKCQASCAPAQLQMCSHPTDCGGGASCIPFKAKGTQFAACL